MSANDNQSQRPLTYRDAGVDIDAGNELVRMIKPFARTTLRPGADVELGGFGGVFDLKAAGFRDPILVSSNDGVGTKLKVAIEANSHQTVGIDLVAMCVNDLVVAGAEPLFFLDYFATGKLSVGVAADVVAGIAEGCRQAGAALIGGETAEMPGMYQAGDYDLAGFAVGAAERGELLPRQDMAPGDILIGLPSSGVHSNGYSLVRRLVAETKLAWTAPAPWQPGATVAEGLLEPTRIYVKQVLTALRATGGVGPEGAIKALSHITGGGISENLPRVLGADVAAMVDLNSFRAPPVFDWLAKAGRLDADEMLRTFNCGIGMILVAAADRVDDVLAALTAAGETAHVIGQLTGGSGARSDAKGKGEAWAVRYTGELTYAS